MHSRRGAICILRAHGLNAMGMRRLQPPTSLCTSLEPCSQQHASGPVSKPVDDCGLRAAALLPCTAVLPRCAHTWNVQDVQRLLAIIEAPDYCVRAFREHAVNGADLLAMDMKDMEDSPFRFPKFVQRKVRHTAAPPALLACLRVRVVCVRVWGVAGGGVNAASSRPVHAATGHPVLCPCTLRPSPPQVMRISRAWHAYQGIAGFDDVIEKGEFMDHYEGCE